MQDVKELRDRAAKALGWTKERRESPKTGPFDVWVKPDGEWQSDEMWQPDNFCGQAALLLTEVHRAAAERRFIIALVIACTPYRATCR